MCCRFGHVNLKFPGHETLKVHRVDPEPSALSPPTPTFSSILHPTPLHPQPPTSESSKSEPRSSPRRGARAIQSYWALVRVINFIHASYSNEMPPSTSPRRACAVRSYDIGYGIVIFVTAPIQMRCPPPPAPGERARRKGSAQGQASSSSSSPGLEIRVQGVRLNPKP